MKVDFQEVVNHANYLQSIPSIQQNTTEIRAEVARLDSLYRSNAHIGNSVQSLTQRLSGLYNTVDNLPETIEDVIKARLAAFGQRVDQQVLDASRASEQRDQQMVYTMCFNWSLIPGMN
jgi:hypothetical protein